MYCIEIFTIFRTDKTINTENSVIFGPQALEEFVGDIKINFTPKTNVWLNALSSEILGNTVAQYLMPTQNTIVVEIGCGTGLTSMMLASVSVSLLLNT